MTGDPYGVEAWARLTAEEARLGLLAERAGAMVLLMKDSPVEAFFIDRFQRAMLALERVQREMQAFRAARTLQYRLEGAK